MRIRGGDQAVNLRDFGIDTVHELEILGLATRVQYFTTKTHLRPEDGGTAVYDHKFGGMVRVRGKRKRSPLPTMVYDSVNRMLQFAGGGYSMPPEGIDG